MPNLTRLKILRDNIRMREDELRHLRDLRDKLAVDLANSGVPERTVGEYAGIAGPYVNQLKKRYNQKAVTR